jgi:hypothetical protein
MSRSIVPSTVPGAVHIICSSHGVPDRGLAVPDLFAELRVRIHRTTVHSGRIRQRATGLSQCIFGSPPARNLSWRVCWLCKLTRLMVVSSKPLCAQLTTAGLPKILRTTPTTRPARCGRGHVTVPRQIYQVDVVVPPRRVPEEIRERVVRHRSAQASGASVSIRSTLSTSILSERIGNGLLSSLECIGPLTRRRVSRGCGRRVGASARR